MLLIDPELNPRATPAMHAIQQTGRLLRLVRLRPFDTSTLQGRSAERYRRALLTTMSAVFSKLIGGLTLLVSVPLTLSYLGPERYGLWMALGSVIAVLSFSDLGIGSGLVNAISEANGRDDRNLARRYVSSAFFMLLAVAALLSILFGVAYPWVPWCRLFNVHSSIAIVEAGPAMAVFFACFLLNLPLGLVNRIQAGYQQGFSSNLWGALGSVLALSALILACKRRAGLPWLVLAMTGAPLLATFSNGAVLFGRQRRWLLPSRRFCDFAATGRIFRIGIMFFVLQIAVAVGFSSDNIVLTQILGPAAVTQYAVPGRMFGVVSMVMATVLAPLWPAYGEALARHDLHWIRKTLRRTMTVALASAIPAYVLLFLSAHKLLHLWVGTRVAPASSLLAGFALWGILTAIGNSLGTFLNAAGVIKFQAIVATLMAGVNLPLSIFLTHRVGVPGPIWGSVVSYSLISLIPIFMIVPRLLRSLSMQPPSLAAQSQ